MSDSIGEMRTASRVLMAISDGATPKAEDVEELLRLAPECSNLPVDELACEVIHRELKRRGIQAVVMPSPRV